LKLRTWKGKFVTKYVEVKFLDHFYYRGNDPYKIPKYNIKTKRGWLLEEDDESILLGLEESNLDKADFFVMRIYKWGILAIDVLEEVKISISKPEDYFEVI